MLTPHSEDGLILESPFLSVRAMANRTVPGSGFLFKGRFDSYEHGRRLWEAASEPKAFYTIAGAHHNDTYLAGGSQYWEAWRKFLDDLPSR